MKKSFALLSALCAAFLAVAAVSCKKSSAEEVASSNGDYLINFPGRTETIYVRNASVNKKLSAEVSGSLYDAEDNTAYSFDTQKIEWLQFNGCWWHAKIYCTDGNYRTILAYREGYGNLLAQGQFYITVNGSSIPYDYTAWDYYANKINFISYSGYDYLK